MRARGPVGLTSWMRFDQLSRVDGGAPREDSRRRARPTAVWKVAAWASALDGSAPAPGPSAPCARGRRLRRAVPLPRPADAPTPSPPARQSSTSTCSVAIAYSISCRFPIRSPPTWKGTGREKRRLAAREEPCVHLGHGVVAPPELAHVQRRLDGAAGVDAQAEAARHQAGEGEGAEAEAPLGGGGGRRRRWWARGRGRRRGGRRGRAPGGRPRRRSWRPRRC